jgi:hypothetical protein
MAESYQIDNSRGGGLKKTIKWQRQKKASSVDIQRSPLLRGGGVRGGSGTNNVRPI